MKKLKVACAITLMLSLNSFANDTDSINYNPDVNIPGYGDINRLNVAQKTNGDTYTIIETNQLVTFLKTVNLINRYHKYMADKSVVDINDKIKLTADFLSKENIDYGGAGAQGEGIFPLSAKHIQQDPTVRFDFLNGTTLMQNVLAMINSNTFLSFYETINKINYGAIRNIEHRPIHKIKSFSNRNHFITTDFTPINERNGYIKNIDDSLEQKFNLKDVTQTYTRRSWFEKLSESKSVRIIKSRINQVDFLQEKLVALSGSDSPFDKEQTAKLSYIPKGDLVTKSNDDEYQPNEGKIKEIPTPAVVYIVRDSKKWNIGGNNISDIIGTPLNVSNTSVIYKQKFKPDQDIYQKIECLKDQEGDKICKVTPVTNNTEHEITKIMLLNSTSAYPNGYVFSKKKNGNYFCTSKENMPEDANVISKCNRTFSKPLGDYLVTKQYDRYNYMDNESIVGIHVEQIIGHNN